MSAEKHNPRIVVTPPAFCSSSVLRDEVARLFPGTRFNDKGRYLTEEEFIVFCRDAEGVLVGRDPVNENFLCQLPGLKIISKYGVGLDNVDQESLRKHQVVLGWTPGVNRRSVAEMTLCFILGLCHNIFSTGYSLKQGTWARGGGEQLEGKVVGIVGCGNIGSEVIRLLAPFGCRILVRDILDKAGFCREYGAREAGLDELAENADIISLHVPLTEQTRSMFDDSVLKRMKRNAFLINTSRGEVVVESDLKSALQEKLIAGAALDVFSHEPPSDLEFLSLPNLMVTPHIGGNALQAVEAMGRAAISHLVKFFNTQNL